MVFSPFSPVHLAADGRLFAELLGEHPDGLAAFDAKSQYRYAHSEIVWQSREITGYKHTFDGPTGERTVVTRHTRGVNDLGGLTAPPPPHRHAEAAPRQTPVRSPLLSPGLLLLVAMGVLAACSPPVAAQADRLVSSFTASPSFNNFREPCAIAYALAQPALVSIRVTRGAGAERVLVASLAEHQKEPRGRRTAHWRGVGPDGRFVPQGEYHVELSATPATGGAPTTYTLATYLYRD